MFTHCSTPDSVIEAVNVLSKADYLVVDCEGRNLGNAVGALSLICIGTPSARETFIFDALALSLESLQPVFDELLSSSSIMKVVWDGRMDYSELFFSYGCAIENVLDLQLVDILSRAARGEEAYTMRRRLTSRFFPPQEVQKLQLEGIHALAGMDRAIREHNVMDAPQKDETVKQSHKDNLTDMWMTRPLSANLLSYAAGDILRISSLFNHFSRKEFFGVSMDKLREHSARYVAMHRVDGGKPDAANPYLRGPYLPLFVLDPPLDSGPNSTTSGVQCTKCRRFMRDTHFPLTPRSSGRWRTRLPVCKICTLIIAREEYQAREGITSSR